MPTCTVQKQKKCQSQGKVCNEKTGRCNKQKKTKSPQKKSSPQKKTKSPQKSSSTVVELRKLAKDNHIPIKAGMKKSDIVSLLVHAKVQVKSPKKSRSRKAKSPGKHVSPVKVAPQIKHTSPVKVKPASPVKVASPVKPVSPVKVASPVDSKCAEIHRLNVKILEKAGCSQKNAEDLIEEMRMIKLNYNSFKDASKTDTYTNEYINKVSKNALDTIAHVKNNAVLDITFLLAHRKEIINGYLPWLKSQNIGAYGFYISNEKLFLSFVREVFTKHANDGELTVVGVDLLTELDHKLDPYYTELPSMGSLIFGRRFTN